MQNSIACISEIIAKLEKVAKSAAALIEEMSKAVGYGIQIKVNTPNAEVLNK